MAPMTTTADARDHLDPWGFGRCGVDDRTAVVEFLDPLDEFVDDNEPLPTLITLPVGPAMQAAPALRLVPPTTAPEFQPTSPAPVRAAMPGALLRLPFPTDRIGVMALFAAVIVAQAFYIGFSMTGEASARPMPVATVVAAPAERAERTPAPLASRVGTLRVDTGSAAAQVLVDEELVGATPYTRDDILAGDHSVRVLFARGGTITRRVTVAAGASVALVLEAPAAAPVAAAGPVSGWLRLDVPFEVQVFEDERLVGSSATDRLMMAAGTHTLALVNSALGYRAVVTVAVGAGKTAVLPVEVPRAPVSLNAAPWAEASVDGQSLGETPLANVMLGLGTHQVTFRHPELGERTETVTVRATGANRVAADLRRQ